MPAFKPKQRWKGGKIPQIDGASTIASPRGDRRSESETRPTSNCQASLAALPLGHLACVEAAEWSGLVTSGRDLHPDESDIEPDVMAGAIRILKVTRVLAAEPLAE